MKCNKLFSLHDKVGVVVGAAGLIGQELVRGLLEEGACVVVADIDSVRGKRLAVQLTEQGAHAVFCKVDIAREKSVAACIAFVDKTFGKIDVWVNAAYPRTKEWGTSKGNPKAWQANVDTHLRGYFLASMLAAQYMATKKRGSIINLSSIYGILGPDLDLYKGTTMTVPAAYSLIKGGIISFTRNAAAQYGPRGVRVNCISPGGVFNKQAKAFVKRYEQKTPLKRMARTHDVVGGVVYLASDAACYVTGHNLVIDGGYSIV